MRDADDLRRRRIRFALTFGVSAGVLLTLYSFPYAGYGVREDGFARYLAAYARVTAAFLHLFDARVHAAGAEIVGRVSLTVAKNCDAMDVNILFASAVLAFPARWAWRAAGIVAGTAVLAVVNVARIASLYQVDVRWPQRFELVHAEVWPLAMVAIAVAIFFKWSRWVEARYAKG